MRGRLSLVVNKVKQPVTLLDQMSSSRYILATTTPGHTIDIEYKDVLLNWLQGMMLETRVGVSPTVSTINPCSLLNSQLTEQVNDVRMVVSP